MNGSNLRKRIAVGAGCALVALASQPVFSQASTTTEELRTQIAQMQKLLQQQQQTMQQMQTRLNELESKKAAEPPVPATPAPAPYIASATAPQTEVSRVHRPPSAPAGVAEPLPDGYVRLGDTGNLLKIDIVAQLDAMVDDKFMGYPDLFIPSSIPVQGAPFHDSGSRTNMSAKQSVVRMDFRRDTDYGVMKVVYKNNFFGFGGPDMDYNLQYLYGELDAENYSLIAGYYLSAFTDIDVFPNTLDYEGPNSFTFKYGPQFRYTPVLYRAGEGKLTMPMSLEKPNADIAILGDYQPYSRWPDVTLGLRWETPDWHIQWANLFRHLAVQSALNDQTRSTNAFATQLTFAAGVFKDDSVQGWASVGKGYANFLQDITGLGLDAAFNPQLQLKAIDAEGYGVGYTHAWSEKLSTSASYGYLKIDPDADFFIDPALPKTTRFASINLAWQFSDRAMFGVEYLWGNNNVISGASGDAQRVQASLRYDLNP